MVQYNVIMQTYIVVFSSENRSKSIIQYLRSFPKFGRITDNAYAIVAANESATDIRNNVNQLKEAGDKIFVIKSGVVAAWNNADASSEWLKANL